jgi:hypothetical protein
MDTTLNGTFCYATSYSQFVSECKDPGSNSTLNITDNWIVANPFDKRESNYMIGNATNYNSSRIIGLIFISDSEITA